MTSCGPMGSHPIPDDTGPDDTGRRSCACGTRTVGGPAVVTATEPDGEARRHPLHAVLAEALRHGMSGVTSVEVHRVWGRWSLSAEEGAAGNVWAGTPEDVADSLVRAVMAAGPELARQARERAEAERASRAAYYSGDGDDPSRWGWL